MENILKIYIVPGASKNELVSPFRDGIKFKIAAQPEKNAANDELQRFLAKHYGVPKRNVEIIRGGTSRQKLVRISKP